MIIKYLIEKDTIHTLQEIASFFHVSKKTVRNDLIEVGELLAESNIKLIKKTGVGVQLIGSEEAKVNLLNQLGECGKVVEPYSYEDRKNYILRKLFFSRNKVTQQELADELYVSKATISKDMKRLEVWLKKNHLAVLIKSRAGISIQGNEEDYRNAIVRYLATENQQYSEHPSVIKKFHRVNTKMIRKLTELIPLDYEKLEHILIQAEETMGLRFTDEAFSSLFIHIAIAIKRMIVKSPIQLSDEIMNRLKEREEFEVARVLAKDIEKGFAIRLPDAEIGYIILHLIGTKVQQIEIDIEGMLDLEDDQWEARLALDEIIQISSRTLNLDLQDDLQLRNGLLLHLIPAFNRLKYGLELKNPILNEIKRNYPEAFGTAWIAGVSLEKFVGKNIPDEELGYIALHIAAAVERQMKPLKTIVICSSGIGTSQLLVARLEKRIRNIEIKGVMSVVDYYQLKDEDIDLIISTIPIEAPRTPLIQVSPVLSATDIKRLDQFITDQIVKKKNIHYHVLRQFIDKDFIELKLAIKTKEELVQHMSSRLINEGYVRTGFTENVLERERLSSTEIGEGIAMPHGLIRDIKKSVIYLVTLAKSILWTDEEVDTVFLICISDEDKDGVGLLMKDITNLTESVEFMQMLRNTTGIDEVVAAI